MIINGIKFRVKDDATLQALRFPTPTGMRRNIACHFADPAALADVAEALSFALDGTKSVRVTHVALQVTDAGGDVWVVERSAESSRFARNGAPHGEDDEASFRAAMWDGDDEGTSHQALAAFRLASHEGSLSAEPVTGRGRSLAVPRDRWEAHFQASLGKVRGMLTAPDNWGAAPFVALSRRLEHLAVQARDAHGALEALQAENAGSSTASLETLARYEQLTDLGQKIRSAAQPFLDPANSPQVLRDKIQRLDGELGVLYTKVTASKQLIAAAADIPWGKILQVLSKMQAYAMLVDACQDAVQRLSTDVSPALDGFTETVGELLERDDSLIRALEGSLAIVSAKAQKATARSTESSHLIKAWDRWISRDDGPVADGGTAATQDLEATREAIECALRQLGALHKSLIEAERTASPIQGLKDYAQKVTQEFLKLKTLWQQTTKHYHLNAEMTLKDIVALMQNAGTILALEADRRSLAERLGRYRQDLKSLESLILEWRQAVQSTKDTGFDSPALVLAEARGILQITGVKEAQLKKIRAEEAVAKARQHVAAYWRHRLDEAETKWRDVQVESGLTPRSRDDAVWGGFFPEAACLAILQAHRTDPSKAVGQEALFSERTLAHPLTLFLWEERLTENRDRLRFLELVENAPTQGHALVLVGDPVMADMLAKLGVSVSQPLRKAGTREESAASPAAHDRPVGAAPNAAIPGRNAPAQSQAGRGSEPDLQERAKAALRMLTGGKHDLLG